MIIIMTIKELMDKDIWADVCDIRGWNVYAVNEGLLDMDEGVYLSEEEMEKLGITINLQGK